MHKMKSYLLVMVLIISIFANAITGQADPFATVQEKLDGITVEEKKVLEQFFIIIQEIDVMESEEERIAQEIAEINDDIKTLENEISLQEEEYKAKQNGLEQVLKSYQRMGPVSYIGIILESDSLSSLIRRINILRDLARNTGELLDKVEESKNKLMDNKDKLKYNIQLLEDRQRELDEALEKANTLKVDLEELISSLGEEKEYYRDYLTSMQIAWDEAKTMFSKIAENFSKIVNESNISPEELNLSFSANGIKSVIKEDTINDIISKEADLEEMVIDFQSEKIRIELPKWNLNLSGKFIIDGEHTLIFQAEEGSFYDMKLENGSIEELFKDRQMVLDLLPYLGNNATIKSVKIGEDFMELIIGWSLF
ncbi:N-terminal domain of peptidoglycan hydrolase CwlO-containing protein [Lutispora thermophila DSM 19022]|uniref:N-terminal domain of peptidoglycan hydrolase CwlO-containing protein n=2 Tax=Lutispora TaxID=667112 RepID=A0A1M6D7V4_9FIRM|nr:N-terminal domain of peptidoglycan hydrolase CwlO-containing protein [Lutispora thermophila DSM 19022]